MANDYSPTFSDRYINKRLTHIGNQNNDNNTPESSNSNNDPFIVLPYNKYITSKISLSLKKFNVSQVNRITNEFNNIIKLSKDELDMLETNNVIYKVNCKDCAASYVGLAARKRRLRRNEYRRDVINNKTLALALHVDETSHSINFDSFLVIDRESNKKKREFSEILITYFYNDTLNHIEDKHKLKHIYKHTIDTLKRHIKH